jgi:hypothetical protein
LAARKLKWDAAVLLAISQRTQAEIVDNSQQQLIRHENLTPALQEIVSEIDNLFGDIQVASLTAYWRVGHRIGGHQAGAPDTVLGYHRLAKLPRQSIGDGARQQIALLRMAGLKDIAFPDSFH